MGAQTTRKTGARHTVTFGSLTLGTARTTSVELTVKAVDASAGGDRGPADTVLGLARGVVQVGHLVTDEQTFGLLGQFGALTLADSAGLAVFRGDVLCAAVKRTEGHRDPTRVDLTFWVQGLPSVPNLGALGV
jgi:hypothetical protein